MATTLPLHAIARIPSLPLSNCRTFNPCQGRARRLHGLKGSIKAAMAEASDTTSPWVKFPRLSPAGKRLMEAVADSMDRELGTSLRPSRTDPEVVSFKGQSGEGSVTLRAGREGSKVCSNVPSIVSVCHIVTGFSRRSTHYQLPGQCTLSLLSCNQLYGDLVL